MNEQDAITCLASHKNRKPSEIGESVDVLYKIYGTYNKTKTAQRLSVSCDFLSSRHRVFQLPKGIRWKVDEGQIGITQARQIAKLKNKEAQWLLAITTVEKKLHAIECENVVNLVLKEDWEIKNALSTVAGVRFDGISPPALMLPVGVDFWFALIQSAWGQSKNWQDLCYQLIREGVDVDNKEIAAQLEALTKNVSTQLESIAVTLRQAGDKHAEAEKE